MRILDGNRLGSYFPCDGPSVRFLGSRLIEAKVATTIRDYSDARNLNWLSLALTPGIGAARGRKLAELFNGVDRIFAATLTELEAAGLPAAAAQSIALDKSSDLAGEELDRIKALGARIVAQDDPDYPKRLYEIYDPPLVLYVRGSSEVINKYGLAVVGTRHPTPYGSGMAERLAYDLAARGLVIVSGMARGVDAAAHRGALNAHGQTVAIWGTGVDVTYPKENQKLADQILASGGAILSEFPLGTFPPRKTFPSATELSAALLSAYSSSKPESIVEPELQPVAHWSKVATFMPSPETSPTSYLGDLTR